MKKTTISVVVPIYNQEKYVSKCINSIMEQSYADFEAILINDGSTDNTGQICRDLIKNDPRFRLFEIKNAGVSNARNVGIENASGSLITFVDSDDWLEKDYLKDIVAARIENPHADLIVTGESKVFDDSERKFPKYYEKYILPVRDAVLKRNFIAKACIMGKTFVLDIIRSNNLTFDVNLKKCEDRFFIFEYLAYAKFIAQLDDATYVQRTYTPYSLSKTGLPFEEEYSLLKQNEFWIRKLFGNPSVLNTDMCNNITVFIYLAISSLYRIKTRRPLRFRLKVLTNLANEYSHVLKKSTIQKRGNFFLNRKLFLLFDVLANVKTFINQKILKRYY